MSTLPITWKETRVRLAADRRRFLDHHRATGLPAPVCLLFEPAWLCVWLHRIAHFLQRRGRGRLARLVAHAGLVLTGGDVAPGSDLGAGLLIPHPAAVSLCGRSGRNLTVMALAGLGGEALDPDRDAGAGPGMPLLGDDVVIEPHAGVLGPVRIGSRVRIRSGCMVTSDVPDDAVVEGPRPRILKRTAAS